MPTLENQSFLLPQREHLQQFKESAGGGVLANQFRAAAVN